MKLFKRGNAKIGKNCLVFCLPTTICPVQCPGCYARRPEFFRPNCLPARVATLEATRRPDFIERAVEEITKSSLQLVRIHESGDFYSQEYLEKWKEIARRVKSVRLYTYTKTKQLFDFTSTPRNLNIIDSMTPIGYNFGDANHIAQLRELGYKLCPCRKGSHVECMVDCAICATAKKVCFLKH